MSNRKHSKRNSQRRSTKKEDTQWIKRGVIIGLIIFTLQMIFFYTIGEGLVTAKLVIFNITIFIVTGMAISYLLRRGFPSSD